MPQAGQASGAAEQATGSAAGQAGSAAGAAVSGPDQKFATMVAQTDLAEIEVGNMALQKSSDPQVKPLLSKTGQGLLSSGGSKGI